MLVLIVLIDFINVKVFGEFEIWLSAIKVIVIVGGIILLIVLALGGGPM
jgi:amino acid transporter